MRSRVYCHKRLWDSGLVLIISRAHQGNQHNECRRTEAQYLPKAEEQSGLQRLKDHTQRPYIAKEVIRLKQGLSYIHSVSNQPEQ